MGQQFFFCPVCVFARCIKLFLIYFNALHLYFTATHLRGITVDPLENRLYMADGGQRAIKTIDFEGKTIKTIVGTDLNWPVGIVVDAEHR